MLPLLVSFSGGETSAFMTLYLYREYLKKRPLYCLFANTGKERKETLDFINEFSLRFNIPVIWIEYRNNKRGFDIVTYETASRNGEPFEAMIKKHGIPNKLYPHCTRELKTMTITRVMTRLFKVKYYDTAIGIRADEPKRVGKHYYPLFRELPTTKQMINDFWSKQPFRLRLKSYEGNCDFCWKKTKRKLLTLLVENPHIADWWFDMELKYGEYVPTKQLSRTVPIHFFREDTSAAELIEDSKTFTDLWETDVTTRYNEDLDASDGVCGSSSCEVF